jgi:hypothetical protein
MNFNKVVRNIDRSLIKKQPASVHPNWIKYRCKVSYKYIVDNIKDEFNQTDWDLVISQLQRYNQRLWLKKKKRKRRLVIFYEDKDELDVILNKYKEKLYTFISRESKDDKIICDWISIKLVRLSQKGNILARDKIAMLLRYLVDYWVEFDRSFFNWKGYNDLIDNHISACIRRFRYAGSFIGYLYRTLEYSGRGLRPLEKFSLDDCTFITNKRIIDKVSIDKKTKEIVIY